MSWLLSAASMDSRWFGIKLVNLNLSFIRSRLVGVAAGTDICNSSILSSTDSLGHVENASK